MNPDIQGKILWNHADKPFTIPWDLYCVTHVHCQVRKGWLFYDKSAKYLRQMVLQDLSYFYSYKKGKQLTQNTSTNDQMILEDKKLYRQLNASNFDLAIVDLIANECRLDC